MKPMNAADRRVIHKLASEHGMETESVGQGRDRHIVLKPGDASAEEVHSSEEDDNNEE